METPSSTMLEKAPIRSRPLPRNPITAIFTRSLAPTNRLYDLALTDWTPSETPAVPRAVFLIKVLLFSICSYLMLVELAIGT
jgi:hypothetical protein